MQNKKNEGERKAHEAYDAHIDSPNRMGVWPAPVWATSKSPRPTICSTVVIHHDPAYSVTLAAMFPLIMCLPSSKSNAGTATQDPITDVRDMDNTHTETAIGDDTEYIARRGGAGGHPPRLGVKIGVYRTVSQDGPALQHVFSQTYINTGVSVALVPIQVLWSGLSTYS